MNRNTEFGDQEKVMPMPMPNGAAAALPDTSSSRIHNDISTNLRRQSSFDRFLAAADRFEENPSYQDEFDLMTLEKNLSNKPCQHNNTLSNESSACNSSSEHIAKLINEEAREFAASNGYKSSIQPSLVVSNMAMNQAQSALQIMPGSQYPPTLSTPTGYNFAHNQQPLLAQPNLSMNPQRNIQSLPGLFNPVIPYQHSIVGVPTAMNNSMVWQQAQENPSRRTCSFPNCPNRIVQGGRCISHGAKRKTCSHPGCEKHVKKAGLCSAHGPARKRCEHEGCTKVAVQGGKCIAHGAKKRLCCIEECTKQGILGNMCKKHYDEVHGIIKARTSRKKAKVLPETSSGQYGEGFL